MFYILLLQKIWKLTYIAVLLYIGYNIMVNAQRSYVNNGLETSQNKAVNLAR